MKIIFNKVIVLGLVLTACGSPRGPIVDAKDASARAQRLVSGTVTTSERSGDYWEVVVKQSNGALIEVKLRPATGDLQSAEDKVGPFDYDLTPEPTALGFKPAVAKAQAIEPGAVEAWELERKDFGFQWEVYIRNAANELHEIKMDAKGTLRSREVKTAVD